MLIKVLVSSCFNVTTKVTSKFVLLEFVYSATFSRRASCEKNNKYEESYKLSTFQDIQILRIPKRMLLPIIKKKKIFISKPLIVTSFTFSSFSYFCAACNEEEALRHTRVRFFFLMLFHSEKQTTLPKRRL